MKHNDVPRDNLWLSKPPSIISRFEIGHRIACGVTQLMVEAREKINFTQEAKAADEMANNFELGHRR